jgi:hypothetical protein
MITSSIVKKIVFALSVIFFISCDSDFNEIGSDIIEDDIHHDNMTQYLANVVAYDRPTGAVQTNNLPTNYLGIYNNPVFGKTVAHFATQLELASVNPTFKNAVIDTVYLYVPYSSTVVGTGATGINKYQLNEVYGDTTATMKLSIYENRYFLRSSDPGPADVTGQKYYSDDRNLVENVAGPLLNTAAVPAENTQFRISAAEIQRKFKRSDNSVKIVERLQPGMYINLDTEFFKNKLINAPEGRLVNNNTFTEYLRGLYFKIEQNGNSGAMALTRFNEGKIVVIYHEPKLDAGGVPVVPPATVSKTLTLNLRTNTINFFDNTFKDAFNTAITSSSPISGDSRLHVKGGAGSMAFLDILSADDINRLREERVLINEANLTFYVDEAAVAGSDVATQPLRVYLYDATRKRPLVDYYADATSNTANPKYNKVVYGGIRESVRLANGETATRYRIRLTNHINNIINKDSLQVKLGLVVSDNINLIGNAQLKAPVNAGTSDVTTLPVSSVISPLGTVFYGTRTGDDVPENKRLKLEIFYTKPN